MSVPGGQDHREETIAQVAWHIDKCCTGGTDNDWVGAEVIVSDVVAPLEAENARLRSTLESLLEAFDGFTAEDDNGAVMNAEMVWEDVEPRVLAAREALRVSCAPNKDPKR